MCTNIDEHIADKKPVNFRRAFRCCTLDVICSFCFGATTNALSAPEFRSPVEHAIEVALHIRRLFKHFRITHYLVSKLPPAWLVYMQPDLKGHVEVVKVHIMYLSPLEQILTCHSSSKTR